eukprot:TRINITY_DN55067_c0_g1_i3.p1 TRINITY_DN55067_c0_g1~~TRINITY_DN55067_c0_g1_i3.p1  ORF type:complete len:327 (+),score=55.51 TRINITY_DN55067_c0_g1_i3:1-981(+)
MSPLTNYASSLPSNNNNRQQLSTITTNTIKNNEATPTPPHQPLIRHRVVSSARVLAIAIMAVRRLRLFSTASRMKREGGGGTGGDSGPTTTITKNIGSLPDASLLPTTTELAIPPTRELLTSITTCASKQDFISHVLHPNTARWWWEEQVSGTLLSTLSPHIGGPTASNKRPWQQPMSTIVTELTKSLEHGSTTDKLGRSFEDGLPSRRFFKAPWHRSLALRYPRGQLVSCGTPVTAIGGSGTGLLMTIVGGGGSCSSSTATPHLTKGMFDPLFTLLTIHTLNSSSVALSSFKATTSAQQAANALKEARAERKIAADLMDLSLIHI